VSEEKLIPIFTTLRERLLHSAERLLNSRESADDALQETFCRLWPRRDDINTEQEAMALSTVTLRNVSIDMLRKRRLRKTETLEQNVKAEIHDNTDIHERFEVIQKIINESLTPVQQTILHKKEYDGESMDDIAEEMNMTQAAVAMQLSRARKMIREQYKRQNDDEV
jgi:RNA polymerase sigma factor (sigma-70 family)